jgi:O-acetyl-ADP-ribose deacetylase
LKPRCGDKLGAKSLGLLAFGTGGGGFPLDEAAQIEVDEVSRYIAKGCDLQRIIFAVYDESARQAVERAIAQSTRLAQEKTEA